MPIDSPSSTRPTTGESSFITVLGRTIDYVHHRFDQRFEGSSASMLFVQLFLVLGWIRAVTEKVINPAWWSGEKINTFVADHRQHAIDWVDPLLDAIISAPALIAALVLVAQVFIVASLLSGKWLAAGLTVAATLNLSFIFAGSTNPSIFYLLLESALLIALIEAATPTEALALRLRTGAWGLAALAITAAPFASSLSPSYVVEDAALVVATWAVCALVATWWLRRRVRLHIHERELLELSNHVVIDLRDSALAER